MTNDKKLSVIFMGTPDFALLPLKGLIEQPLLEIKTVVTQPDKKTGRGGKNKGSSPVKIMAEHFQIPVLQPENVNDAKFVKLLSDFKPDFIVVVAFGQKLSNQILKIPKYGAINIHASLLPKYRGASPIHESLLKGDKETGVSIMEMASELDKGGIYLIKRMEIGKDDNIITLSNKLSMLGAIILPFVIIDIANNKIRPIPQNETKASYCSKIAKKDGIINWKNEGAEEIVRKIKAFYAWPGSFTYMNGKQFRIYEAREGKGKANPGEIVFLNKKEIGIGTKKGLLLPKKVQLEGKKEMKIEEFLKGYTDTLRKTKLFTSSK